MSLGVSFGEGTIDTPGKLLHSFGLLKGEADNLKEDDYITRAEMMVFLSRLMKVEGQAQVYEGASTFEDANGHWAEKYINYARDAKWTSGKSPTVFDPEGRISEREAYTYILRVLGYENAWQEAYDIANSIEIRVIVQDPDNVRRGDVFSITVNALNSIKVDDGKSLGLFLELKPFIEYENALKAEAEKRKQAYLDSLDNTTFNSVMTASISTLDSSSVFGSSSINVLENTMEGLFRLESSVTIEEGLAESYTVSDDGLVWIFKLKKDTKWSNGDLVTAEDFIYSWRRLASPECTAEYGLLIEFANILNAVDVRDGKKTVEELGVEALDDYTVKITLDKPTVYLPEILARVEMYPINKTFAAECGELYGSDLEHMVFNGPFILSEWDVEGTIYVLSKNKDYHQAEDVKIEMVNIHIIKERSIALQKYVFGEIDHYNLYAAEKDTFADSITKYDLLSPIVYYLEFNHSDQFTSNLNVRKALSLAIDKGELAAFGKNKPVPVNYVVPRGLTFDAEGKDFGEGKPEYNMYNLDLAKAKWAEAKEALGVETIELVLLAGESSTSKTISENIKAQLERNLEGLTVTLANKPFVERIEMTDNKQFALKLSGFSSDYRDPMTLLDVFEKDSIFNKGGYEGGAFNEMLVRCKSGDLSNLEGERWAALEEAEKILLEDDVAIVPIWQNTQSLFVHMRVKDLIVNTMTNSFVYRDIVLTKDFLDDLE